MVELVSLRFVLAYTLEIALVVACTLLIAFMIVTSTLYQRWRYERQLDNLTWKIDFRDIQLRHENDDTDHTKTKTNSVRIAINFT